MPLVSRTNQPAVEPADPAVPEIPMSDRPPGRRRPRRRWLVALVALLAIVALVAVAVPSLLFPAASGKPPETIWQTITDGITDSTVPKQTALEAFAYLYKVDIPGVTVPKGIEGGDEPSDGSGPMSWVHADWDQLTSDQQAVIKPSRSPARSLPATPQPSMSQFPAKTHRDCGRRSSGVTRLMARRRPDWPSLLSSAAPTSATPAILQPFPSATAS
jgi:hypothetical protein